MTVCSSDATMTYYCKKKKKIRKFTVGYRTCDKLVTILMALCSDMSKQF